jgi:predicted ATP-dependent endonuclease of OLD family
MFVKSLHIKNFKCFTDRTIENIAVPNGSKGSGLNILIGENGNGKTTILEAINYLTLNSFSVENKLSINDFNNYKEEIKIVADIDDFKCKSSIGFYNSWYFTSNGVEFSAKSREKKERNKLLSSAFETHSFFNVSSNYKDENGIDKKEVDSRDKPFNNNYIDGDGLNVFYFDKNRNRQITTGNYKTTFERILEDLNWKFIKNLNAENEKELVKNITGEYFNTVDKITESSAGAKTALDLKNFFGNEEYENLKIDLINLLIPFSNAFFTIRKTDELKQVSIKDLGSGVEIILTLLLLKNIAGASKGKIIYLIDEPELHLHPKAQEKLLDLLLEESKDKQIFISTHSPYMFKGSFGAGANLLLLKRNSKDEIDIVNAKAEGWGLFGDISPTWGEVNWFAYNLPTIEFHNELYGFIQSIAIDENEKYSYEREFDDWLVSKGLEQNRSWIKEIKGVAKEPQSRTLQTFIRNSIHHPENKHNKKFTDAELKLSIEQMIKILQE